MRYPNIEKEMQEQGISMEDMARSLYLSRVQLEEKMMGSQDLTMEEAVKLSKLFGKTMTYLFQTKTESTQKKWEGDTLLDQLCESYTEVKNGLSALQIMTEAMEKEVEAGCSERIEEISECSMDFILKRLKKSVEEQNKSLIKYIFYQKENKGRGEELNELEEVSHALEVGVDAISLLHDGMCGGLDKKKFIHSLSFLTNWVNKLSVEFCEQYNKEAERTYEENL